jgi:hypothetical protein
MALQHDLRPKRVLNGTQLASQGTENGIGTERETGRVRVRNTAVAVELILALAQRQKLLKAPEVPLLKALRMREPSRGG